MQTIRTSDIDINRDMVATYNADAFAVESNEMISEIIETLGYYVNEYFPTDSEYEDLAMKLDGNANTYEHIYHANGITLGILR